MRKLITVFFWSHPRPTQLQSKTTWRESASLSERTPGPVPIPQLQKTPAAALTKVDFIGGNLSNNIDFWQSLTSDPYILNAIRGYELEFADNVEPSDLRISCDNNNGDSNILKEEVKKLLKLNIIELSFEEKHQVISPIFTVSKPDGGNRLILNLKALNNFIIYRHFKMERAEQAQAILEKDWFMGSIDLEKAYHSVLIHPSSRKYLKFRLHGQLYQYRTLPMGLSSAPYLFTKILKVFSVICAVKVPNLFTTWMIHSWWPLHTKNVVTIFSKLCNYCSQQVFLSTLESQFLDLPELWNFLVSCTIPQR